MSVKHEELLRRAREIASSHLEGAGVRVFLIGSHATGTAYELSDIDIAVETRAGASLPPGLLARLREAFEESTIPCRVDVVDLDDADDAFKRRVHETGVEWTVSANA